MSSMTPPFFFGGGGVAQNETSIKFCAKAQPSNLLTSWWCPFRSVWPLPARDPLLDSWIQQLELSADDFFAPA
jgi:hypothetical protein